MIIKMLENQRKLCHIFEQAMVFVQIIAIFLIFLVSLYWFLELIGNGMLSFLDSFIKCVRDLMQLYFADSLQKGQAGLDGSLFIFIVLLGMTIYVSAQVKIFLKFKKETLDRSIIKQREDDEIKFNKHLQEDVRRKILEYKNIVMIVDVRLKSLLKDVYAAHNDVKNIDEKQESVVLVALYNMIKTVPNCTFTKDGKYLIISSKNFNMVDPLLLTLNNSLVMLKNQLKARKLAIDVHMAIDVFPDNVHMKDVYADLKTLLNLNMPNEILCYGNFCNRYEHVQSPNFEAYLKGTYDITDDENVWSLIKKD